MSESVRKYLLLALTGLLTANLFFSITTSLVLSFIIIAIQLVCLRKEDSAFLFLLLGSTFGAFYAQNGVRFVGSFLVWGSALYLLKDLISYRKNWFANYRPLLFFIFLILFSILITTGGSYSKEKFIAMMMNVVPFTIAFSHLILYKEKHSFGHIGLMYVLYSIFLLVFMNEQMNVKVNLNTLLFSFAGFRYDINEYIAGDKEVWHVGYQSIGIHGCIGLIYALFSNDKYAKQFRTWIIALSALVVWYAAARQAILLYAVIWLVYFTLYKGLSLRNLIALSALVAGGYLLLLNLDNDSLEFLMGSTDGKDSARDRIMDAAMLQFYQNPVFGVGFGRFFIGGEYGCNEHNLFVELLTEMGVVGLLAYVGLCARPLLGSYKFAKQNLHTYAPFFLLLLSYLLRSMVSSDLRETIVILILALSIHMGCKYKITSI